MIAVMLAASLLAVAPADSVAPTDSLTVRQAVARALGLSLEAQAARWSAVAAARDADAARHNASPRFRLHSGLLVAPSGFYDPAITNLGEYDLKLMMELGLLDGGQRRRDRLHAQALARGAEAERAALSAETALEAGRLASAVLLGRRRIERREEEERWATRVLDSIRSGARAGVRSPSDVNRLHLELQTLLLDRVDLASELRSAGRSLAALLMPERSGGSFLGVRDTAWNESAPSAEDSLGLARRFAASATVRGAEVAAGIADLELETARRQGAAQLGLGADAGLAGTDLTRLAPPQSDGSGSALTDRLHRDLGASVSLDFSLPLRPPGLGATVAARTADAQAAQLRLRAARAAASVSAVDLVGRWRDATFRVTVADSGAALAESNLLRARSLYLAGSITLLELLDARRTWQEAADRADISRSDLHAIGIESEIPR